MPPKPKGDHAMTGAERVRKHRERKRLENPILTDRQKLVRARQEIEQLRQTAAKAAPALLQELVQARKEIARLTDELAAARTVAATVHDLEKVSATKPKPRSGPKPPLDPGSEVARQIKALKTRIRNLQDQLGMEREFFLKQGRMDFATRSMIAKVLHPEATLSDKARDDAYKAFTAWTADSKAAGRR